MPLPSKPPKKEFLNLEKDDFYSENLMDDFSDISNESDEGVIDLTDDYFENEIQEYYGDNENEDLYFEEETPIESQKRKLSPVESIEPSKFKELISGPNKKYIFISGGIILFILVLIIISSLFSLSNRNNSTLLDTNIKIIKLHKNSITANVSTSKQTTGIIQAVYKENERYIVCESVDNNYSKEPKEVTLDCLNSTGNVDELKQHSLIFVETE